MSGEGLSQEEIDALLAGGIPPAGEEPAGDAPADAPAADDAADAAPADGPVADGPAAEPDADADAAPAAPAGDPPGDVGELLSADERDALGEIGNITMASAATALNALLNQPVQITTPRVSITSEDEVKGGLSRPAVSITVGYTVGLNGQNVFVLARRDCSVIVDLMMGGDGSNASDELDELQLSGVSEAMNQMMGSAATSLASIVGHKVDISTPDVTLLDPDTDVHLGLDDGHLVKVAFDLTIGSLLETEIMQLLPLGFAKELVEKLMSATSAAAPAPDPGAPPSAAEDMGFPEAAAIPDVPVEPMLAATAAAYDMPPIDYGDRHLHAVPQGPPPTVQPAAFPSLDRMMTPAVQGDIGMLLDVPLQVTVELGRTELRIRNVLELAPGSIIELEKLSGEPVDVLVNGRQIARGEVVVIDEEFGVRITDIASRAARLRDAAGA